MNGLEKITQRIQEDAQQEIDRILSQAKEQAEAITQTYQKRAALIAQDMTAKGQLQAQQREERMESVAALEGRKLLLAMKQEVLAETFDLAMEKLCALDTETYADLLARLLVQASTTGREEVIFNQADRTQVGKAAVTAANERLAKAVAPKLPQELTENKVGAFVDKVVTGVSAMAQGTGMLTLSQEVRPIRGGFILVDGPVEVNCTFETLMAQGKERMSGDIAAMLFPQDAVS